MLKYCEDITTTKKRLTIEIPAETLASEYAKVISDFQKKVKVPGFRPGKTPISLIEKKFGNDIEAKVLDDIIPKNYIEALKEANLVPVASPTIEENIVFNKNSPLKLVFTVEVRPNIPDLEYAGILIKEYPINVTDDEITDTIYGLADRIAEYQESNEPIKNNDLVTLDYFVINPESDDIPEEYATATDITLKIGTGPYPTSFFDNLIGKQKDDEFEFLAQFPQNAQSPFAGKTPRFKIKIKDVKQKNIPPIDDELAKDLGFDNMAELRERVNLSLINAKTADARVHAHLDIIDTLLQKYDFDLPEILVKKELEKLIEQNSSKSNDEALEDITKTDALMMQELMPDAKRHVKISLLLEIIADKENVTVSEDDINNEINSLALKIQTHPENIVKHFLNNEVDMQKLVNKIRTLKTLDLIYAKANIIKGENE